MVYSEERHLHTSLRCGDTPNRQVTYPKAALINKRICWQQASMNASTVRLFTSKDKLLLLPIGTAMTDKDCWLRFICVFMFLSWSVKDSFLRCLFSVTSDSHFSLKMSAADLNAASPCHGITMRLIDRYLLVYISSALVCGVCCHARWHESQSLSVWSDTHLLHNDICIRVTSGVQDDLIVWEMYAPMRTFYCIH